MPNGDFHSMIRFREVRDFSQVLSTAFVFLRQNFKPLLRDLVYVVGPVIIILAIVQIFYMRLFGDVPETYQNPSSFFLTLLGLMVCSGLAYVLLYATVNSHILLYMQHGPRQYTSAQVVEMVKRFFWRLAVGMFVAMLLVGVGFMLCGIPGIYFYGVLSILPMVLMAEDRDAMSPIGRSFDLVSGHWWQTFLLVVVASFLQFSLGWMVMIPNTVAQYVMQLGTAGVVELSGAQQALLMVLATLGTVVGTLLYAITCTVTAVQYFNLVERKELVGLQERIEQIALPAGEIG